MQFGSMREYRVVLVRPQGRGKVDLYVTEETNLDVSRRVPMDAFGFSRSVEAAEDVVRGLWEAEVSWIQHQPERGVASGTFKSGYQLMEGL